MADSYSLLGWINADTVSIIRERIIDKWSVEPHYILGDEKRRLRFTVNCEPNTPNEFDPSFSLDLYFANIGVDESSAAKTTKLDATHYSGALKPFVIDFHMFSRHHIITSVVMLEKPQEICDMLNPVLIISIGEIALYAPHLFDRPTKNIIEEPSMELVREHMAGLCCISNDFGLKHMTKSNPALYRVINYDSGQILCGPMGVAAEHELTATFYDDNGNFYTDHVLDELLYDKQREFMNEMTRILLNINIDFKTQA